MRIRFFSREFSSVFGVSIGRRTSIDVFVWAAPAVEWGWDGYAGIWKYWAVYPLFEVELFTEEFDTWAEECGAKLPPPVFELTIGPWTWSWGKRV